MVVDRRQSLTPAVASIMRDRRVQFLPVQWRINLKLDADEEQRRESAGLDNDFTLTGAPGCACSRHSLTLVYHRYNCQEYRSLRARSDEQRPYRHSLLHEV